MTMRRQLWRFFRDGIVSIVNASHTEVESWAGLAAFYDSYKCTSNFAAGRSRVGYSLFLCKLIEHVFSLNLKIKFEHLQTCRTGGGGRLMQSGPGGVPRLIGGSTRGRVRVNSDEGTASTGGGGQRIEVGHKTQSATQSYTCFNFTVTDFHAHSLHNYIRE